jgi:hypothetical protein
MRLSCLLLEETVPPVWQTMPPDHGVRERPCAQVATRLRRREDQTGRGMQRSRSRTNRDRPRCVCGQRRTRGRRDCGQSGPSLNSNCQKTRRKQLRFVNDGGALWMRSCRQRLPRVRSSAGLGNGEIWAKTGEICACASTAACKPAWIGMMNVTVLLKSGASRLEKASRCSGNGAAGDKLSGRSGGCGLFPDARWMVAKCSLASLPRDKKSRRQIAFGDRH